MKISAKDNFYSIKCASLQRRRKNNFREYEQFHSSQWGISSAPCW